MSDTWCDTEESYAETATVNVFELSTSSVKDLLDKQQSREVDQEMGEEVEFKRFKSQGDEIIETAEALIGN